VLGAVDGQGDGGLVVADDPVHPAASNPTSTAPAASTMRTGIPPTLSTRPTLSPTLRATMASVTLGAGVIVGEHYHLAARLDDDLWQATDLRTGQAVALRFVALPDDEQLAQGFAQRLHINARVLARLTDPRIVALIESGEDPDAGLFLVTRLAHGEPLSAILEREGRLSPRRTMTIIAGAAEALGLAHDIGMSHRDLHPGCLFVDAQDHVELGGLGNFYLRRDAVALLMPRPTYASPEAIRGELSNPESDIYALGIISYECLTGAPPFIADHPFEVALLHVKGVPAPLPNDVPPCVVALVDRAVAKQPGDRWHRPADFADAARSCAATC